MVSWYCLIEISCDNVVAG
ncbi:hypothetical protein GTP56_11030 [Duganella sp. FT134W]|uniref:Uncharacterized protein n=1 Tax=Duganella margarita TaxID=2692170 RepID=A0A7X4KGT0_9BURK|nr:hypothetical protein [Duganella margarita]